MERGEVCGHNVNGESLEEESTREGLVKGMETEKERI